MLIINVSDFGININVSESRIKVSNKRLWVGEVGGGRVCSRALVLVVAITDVAITDGTAGRKKQSTLSGFTTGITADKVDAAWARCRQCRS